MSVKQAVGVPERRWRIQKNKIQKVTVVKHFSCFVLGFLFSLSELGENFSPFGVAFASAVSGQFSLSACVGSVLGWLTITDSVASLRYIAAALAVCVVKNALKSFSGIYQSRGEAVGVAFLCLGVTGFATVFANGLSFYSVAFCFAEGVVGATSAFLFYKVKSSCNIKGGLSLLSPSEITTLGVCVMLLLLALRNWSVFGIYPAHVICGVIVSLCAYYNRESGGSVSGICAGVTMGLGTGNVYLLGVYSLGGLACGVFSQFGKIPGIISFVLSGAIVVGVSSATAFVGVLAELLLISVIFFVVVNLFGKRIELFMKPAKTSPIAECVKNEVYSRLKNASEISAEICSSLTGVNDALSKSEKSDIRNVSQKTKERICGSCGLYDVCWGENLSETQDVFNTMLNMKKEGTYLEYKTVPTHFAARCIRTESVAGSFNRLYSDYSSRKKTENRLKEMHNLAAEQFVNVSGLLDSLCEKMNQEIVSDEGLASRVTATAKSWGLEVLGCNCIINSLGKMTVELKIKSVDKKTDFSRLCQKIQSLALRKFDLPVFYRDDRKNTIITLKEKPEFRVASSGVQYCADDEKYSGDTFSTFEDDNGVFYAVICDGMGTGGRAAVASNLAVMLLEKLIKAGFGVVAAINTVNTSLISKSGEECSVTLDLAVVDLFTGITKYYKSGASETIVKRSGKISSVNMPSLPLGIISNTEIGCTTCVLDSGDSFIMFSDGVRDEDKDLLKKGIKAFDCENVKRLSADFCKKIRTQQSGKRDDLTVLSVYIEENE